jgi:hypothetical protein
VLRQPLLHHPPLVLMLSLNDLLYQLFLELTFYLYVYVFP